MDAHKTVDRIAFEKERKENEIEYNEKIKEMTIETAEQWFTINPKYRTKKRLLDDIITNLTQDTNPKE